MIVFRKSAPTACGRSITRHRKSGLITLLSCLTFIWTPASAQEQVWPDAYRDSAFVNEHFTNDNLYRQLKSGFEDLQSQLRNVIKPLGKYPESKKLEPSKWTNYPWRLSEKQINEFKQTGKVKLREFGWAVSQKSLARNQKWLQRFKAQMNFFATNNSPEKTSAGNPELQRLNKEKQRLSDSFSNNLYYLERTRKWDDYCRKGAWLLEPALRSELQRQIAALNNQLETLAPPATSAE